MNHNKYLLNTCYVQDTMPRPCKRNNETKNIPRHFLIFMLFDHLTCMFYRVCIVPLKFVIKNSLTDYNANLL